MKKIYLFLAIIGGIVPYIFFFHFFQNYGFNITTFITALFPNGAASGFTADLVISSFIFWIFLFHQYEKGAGPKPILFIFMNLFLGLSCALPAYLYAREE